MLDSAEKIRMINAEMGASLSSLLNAEPALSPEHASATAMICESMLGSGWYGETTCGEYIQLCVELSGQADLWLSIGAQCQVFAKNNRVTLEYLRSLQQLIGQSNDPVQISFSVKTINALLNSAKTESPALLVDLIKTATQLFPERQQPFDWADAAAHFSAEPPTIFQAFLKLSRSLYPFTASELALKKGINHWQWLVSIGSIDAGVALEFMEVIPHFGKLLNNSETLSFLTTIAVNKTLALELLRSIGKDWDSDCLSDILPFAVELAIVDINSIQQLLLTSKQQALDLTKLEAWLQQGLEYAREDVLTGQAWFALESLKSKDFYRDIRGAVHLGDCSQLLNLVSEGLGGGALSVIAIEQDQWKVDNFAESIQLPVEISIFDNQNDNFSLYRLMILYQVSFWESGVADFLNQTGDGSAADFISTIDNPTLGTNLLNIYLAVYVEHYMVARYRGIKSDLQRWQQYYLSQQPVPEDLFTVEGLLNASLEAVSQSTSDAHGENIDGSFFPDHIFENIQSLMSVVKANYEKLRSLNEQLYLEPVGVIFYRGSITVDIALLSLKMESLKEEVDQISGDDDSHGLSDILDPDNVTVEELRQGDTENAMGQFLTDLEGKITEGDLDDEDLKEKAKELRGKLLLEHGKSRREAQIFTYNEWDYLIKDYRKDWCMLHQILLPSESEKFVKDTLNDHRDLLRQIRKQLQMLKPELHRKVRGLLDGEDIHHDDAIDAMIDLKSGVSPDEKIYIQRLKAERDVSTLFLLDMSASTDESIESFKKTDPADPQNEVVVDSQSGGNDKNKSGPDAIDYLMDAYDENLKPAQPKEEVRIIDIERQSVVLMAEALEELGDSYAIGGFSGYGREQVEYFLCKDFDEHYNSEIKGRIEAISPRRSTRMGPPIRHGIAQLNKTESKVKAMIIISDGYPQDFDYGKDRKSKVYGIEDTAKALQEAKKEGIHTFCLTVDPSGHDYLKDMCPDDQYMIITDIEDLPKELSRVYSTLTS